MQKICEIGVCRKDVAEMSGALGCEVGTRCHTQEDPSTQKNILKTNNSNRMKSRMYNGLVAYNLRNQIIIFHNFIFFKKQSNYYKLPDVINCHP
jgi:hypothetical protein